MKTTLTKNQVALHVFTAPTAARRFLHGIYTDGVIACATDSFRLVEITKKTTIGEAIKPVIIDKLSAKAIKIPRPLTSCTVDTEEHTAIANGITYPLAMAADPDEYPEYAKLFTEHTNEDDVVINVSGAYLAEIAEALSKIEAGRYAGKITLRIPQAAGKPIIITAEGTDEKARAMLMPLRD
jgi:hypothetical protein